MGTSAQSKPPAPCRLGILQLAVPVLHMHFFLLRLNGDSSVRPRNTWTLMSAPCQKGSVWWTAVGCLGMVRSAGTGQLGCVVWTWNCPLRICRIASAERSWRELFATPGKRGLCRVWEGRCQTKLSACDPQPYGLRCVSPGSWVSGCNCGTRPGTVQNFCLDLTGKGVVHDWLHRFVNILNSCKAPLSANSSTTNADTLVWCR